MRLSIRWKMVLGIGLPLLIVYAGTLVLVTAKLQERGYERLRQHVMKLAGHYAARLDGRFSTFAQVGRTTAAFLTEHPEYSEQELFAMLEANVQQDPLIYGSCVSYEPFAYSSDRRLYCPYVYRAEGGLKRMDVADAYDYTDPKWEWYRIPRETGEAFWTEPFFDEGAGNIVMCTFVAPFFKGGKFRGTVNIDIPLDKLQQNAGADVESEETIMIISRAGRFIVYPDPEYIMNETMFSLAEHVNVPTLATAGRRMVSGETGVERVVGFAGLDASLMFFAPIRSTGWSVAAILPEERAFAFERDQMVFGISMMLGALALITLALLIAASRITRPIHRLAKGVNELSSGNLDAPDVYVHSTDEIGALAGAFNTMVKDLRGHVAALTDATRAREAVESELRVARNIQNALLPRTFPPFPHLKEFELHAMNTAARHIGGDFFDYFFVDKDVLMIVIADVSGKGVPAAMFMAVARTIIRNLAATCPSPGLLLTRTNALLLEDNTEFLFVTMFVARYNIRTGRLLYANGGHPQPYLLNGGRPTRFGEVTGTIVGVLPDLTYAEASAELKPGDRLVFYTDGVTEARSPSGEFLYDSGFEIMLATMNGRSAREICMDCIRRVTEYQADEIADDITVMVLQRN